MIVGIGHDMVDIRRIERLLKEQGERFTRRIFCAGELAYAKRRESAGEQAVAAVLAKRFAAKEAFAKAMGTGIGEIHFTEIEVVNDMLGAPQLVLHGHALTQWENKLMGTMGAVHVSLSDEYPYASAFVVLSHHKSPQSHQGSMVAAHIAL